MFEKLAKGLNKKIQKYPKDKLYIVNRYSKDVVEYLKIISLAERISKMENETAFSEIQKKENRELFDKHINTWSYLNPWGSRSKEKEILESVKGNFLGFVSERLRKYNSKRFYLNEYEKDHERLLESADEFPELKAEIAKIDMRLANIETLERDVFSNPRILMLMSKREQEGLREKYKLGQEGF